LVIDDLSFHARAYEKITGTKRKPVPVDIIPDENPKKPRPNAPQGTVTTGSEVWAPNGWTADPNGQFHLPLFRDTFGTVWVLQPNPNYNGRNPAYVAWMSLNNWEAEHLGPNAVTTTTAPSTNAPDSDEEEDDMETVDTIETWKTRPVSNASRQEMLKAIRDYRKKLHRVRVEEANQSDLRRILPPESPQFQDPPKVSRKTLLDTPVVAPQRVILKPRPKGGAIRRIYDPSTLDTPPASGQGQSKKHSDVQNLLALIDVPGNVPLPLAALPKGTPGTQHRKEWDMKWLGVVNAGPGNTVSSFDEAVADGPIAVAAWIHDIQVSAAANAAERKQADIDFIDFLDQVPPIKRDGAWHVAREAIASGIQNIYYYLYL